LVTVINLIMFVNIVIIVNIVVIVIIITIINIVVDVNFVRWLSTSSCSYHNHRRGHQHHHGRTLS
jgi:hypothetical protein